MIVWSIHKRFVHPRPVKKPVLLGYGRLVGGEPVFLPAEDAADWDSDDAWMDLDAWRRWVGGTLTDHVTELLTEAEFDGGSSSAARTVGAVTPAADCHIEESRVGPGEVPEPSGPGGVKT